MLNSYRARLIFYSTVLVSFLLATLSYSYIYSRDVILEQAELNISNTARLLSGKIKAEENELLHHATVIRDDPRIQEYMFMVTSVGAEASALRQLYKRNFDWLPINKAVFIDLKGESLFDSETSGLATAVLEHMQHSQDAIFYHQEKNGLEMVAWESISYQGTPLGTIAVTHSLDNRWIRQHHGYSGGHLFVEKDNIVQMSCLLESEGKAFAPRNNSIVINGNTYQTRAISLAGEDMGTSRLWYGISEQELLAQLEKHRKIILALATVGGFAILIIGLLMARNFNRPLRQLMQITHAVTQGALPTMDKATEANEIGALSNRFSEMLQSLREKQQEIDKVHKQLKESAITDSLTGLHNRRHLKEVFPKLFAQAKRESHCLSGLMLDLDHFKKINDRHGHLTGDQCLIHMSKILKESCRASDHIFRMGGEEFLILSLSETPQGAELLAEKICTALAESPVRNKRALINMTTSVGVGQSEIELDAEAALTNLLFHADKALYAAKNAGRNQVIIFNNSLQDASPLHGAEPRSQAQS
jgi:diguanylate cyclase (GGDEF)-like protein